MTMNDCLAATGTDAGPVILSIALFLIALGIVAAIRGRGKGAMAALLALPLLLGAVVISQTGAVTAYAAVDCPPEDSGVDAGGETAEPTPSPTPTPTPTTEPDPSPEPSPSPDPEPSPDPSPSPDPEPSPSPDPEPDLDCPTTIGTVEVGEFLPGDPNPLAGPDNTYGLEYAPFASVGPEDWEAAGFTLPLTLPDGTVTLYVSSLQENLVMTADIIVTEDGAALAYVDRDLVDDWMPDGRLFDAITTFSGIASQGGCEIAEVSLTANGGFDFNAIRF